MVPYLRVANVFEDRIDTNDVMEMHFAEDEFERFRLKVGDVLLNEGQSPHLLGRPAIYRGEPPNVAFTNSLIRFRASSAVMPEWALVVFRHHMHSRRFMREARITTNIAHLSLSRLSRVEFPIPPLAEQKRIIAAIEEEFSRIDAGLSVLRNVRIRIELAWAALLDKVIRRGQKASSLRRLGDVVEGMEAGKSFQCLERPATLDEWGVIKVSAMTWGEFRSDENKTVTDSSRIDTRFEIRQGDLLVSRANTVDYVGAPVLVERTRPRLLLSDKSIRLRVGPAVLPKWLVYALRSRLVRRQSRQGLPAPATRCATSRRRSFDA
jgi:type I restriction enzyme S subunit